MICYDMMRYDMTHYERDEKEQVSNRRRFHEIVARCELNVRNKEIKRTKE